MSRLRFAVVDIVVVVLMVLGTLGGQAWAAWAIWIYTPFMLLLRLVTIGAKGPKQKNQVPEVLYHALFALNVVLPLHHGWRSGDTNWYWVGGAWVVIWALSAYAAARQRKAA